MAHAYTPGLKVSEKALIRKERRLPLKGEVVAKVGDDVNADTVVAKTELPGDVQPLNIGGILGIAPEDIDLYLVKKPGDSLKKDEIIAQTKGFFGLFKTTVKAPFDGSLESVSKITGQAILRMEPEPVEVTAYIDGKVTEVFEKEGVLVETSGAFVQGIFGIGGEENGVLEKIVDKPQDVITTEEITEAHKGKILIGGSLVTKEVLEKAATCGCKGIIAGGIGDRDLRDFLGYDIGVAITGSEEKGVTVVITEGFSRMNMAERTFKILTEHEGERASINGATQIRAGVLRPEVIIPYASEVKGSKAEKDVRSSGLEIGSPVRIIREPHFGALGAVSNLPPELRQIETEAKVRILEVELQNGEKVIVPRANVEMIEEY
jgi:hypothetical protein